MGKYFRIFIGVLVVMLISVAAHAESITEQQFLDMLYESSTWSDVYAAFTENIDMLGVNTNNYNRLNETGKQDVIKKMIGKKFETISDFSVEFDSICKSKTSTGGGSSGSGGSSSGGSGGSSSGGSGSSGSSGFYFPYNKYTFSGTVSLPYGEFAPKDGIIIYLGCNGVEENPNYVEDTSGYIGGMGIAHSSFYVTIPEGENSIAYSISEYIHEKYINVVTTASLDCAENYMPVNVSNVIELADSDSYIADIKIEYTTSTITGEYLLENDKEALTEALTVLVTLTDSANKASHSKMFTLDAGNKKVAFALPALLGHTYSLSHISRISGINQQHIYDKSIYYEGLIYVNSEQVSEIELLAEYRDVVKGKVSLPAGMTAGGDGQVINIHGASTVSVCIENGKNSTEYIVAAADIISFYPEHNNYDDVLYAPKTVEALENNFDVILDAKYTVYGTISLSEAAIDDLNLRVECYNDEKSSHYSMEYVSINHGENSVNYMVELYGDFNLGDSITVRLYNSSYSNKYVNDSYVLSEKDITLSSYNTNYDTEQLYLEKAAVVFKGTIQIPEKYQNQRNSFYIKAEGDNDYLTDSFYTSIGDSTLEFELCGNTANILDYNGDYEIDVLFYDYSSLTMHYDGNNLSVIDNKKISVKNQTVALNLTIPEANYTVSGDLVLPVSCKGVMNVEIVLLNNNETIGYREINIPFGVTQLSYTEEYLINDENSDYQIEYRLLGENISPYCGGLSLYSSENGYCIEYENAKNYSGINKNINLNIDLTPFVCYSGFKGAISLPFGIVPSEYTYFNVDVYASNGDKTEHTSVRFNEGESKKDYSISIPEMYSDGDWKVYYVIGTETATPSAPTIPTTVIYDSDFSYGPTAPGRGGDGRGAAYSGPYRVIPKEFIQGAKVYYCNNELSFNAEDAQTFVVSDSYNENIDFTVLTTDTNYPRTIGGYFCSTVPDVAFSVSLLNAETKAVENENTYTLDGENIFYKFTVYGNKNYILKFTYDDKVYYYKTGDWLTVNIDEATAIEASANINQFGYNVHYENINRYYPTTNQRYFAYRIISNSYENIKICLFDQAGNIISQSRKEALFPESNLSVYIGFEYCGQYRYFKSLSRGGSYKNLLFNAVTDIREAKPFRLPHVSDGNIVVDLNLSDFVSGKAMALSYNTGLNETYFDYSEENDKRNVNRIFIEPESNVFNGNNSVYIAAYSKDGKMKCIKIVKRTTGNAVELSWSLGIDDYIKVIGLKSEMQPMFEQLEFFKEK